MSGGSSFNAWRRGRRLVAAVGTVIALGGAAAGAVWLNGPGHPGGPTVLGAANVWVAPQGSDSGSDCIRSSSAVTAPNDLSTVCASFNEAYEKASCGDTVRVAGGTYAWQRIIDDPSKDSCSTPVTFEPATGATVAPAEVWIAGDWITIRDMTVPDNGCADPCNVTADGTSGDTGSGNGHIWIAPYPWASGHTPNHDTIDGGSAPYFDVRCATNATVENGDYGPNYDYASHPSWGGASCLTYSQNVLVQGNEIHDIILRHVGAHTNCMAAYNFDGLTIRDNLIHGCENIAFRANWQSTWIAPTNGYNDNLTFENNVIWDGSLTGSNDVQFVNPGGTYTIRNNSDLDFSSTLNPALTWDISTDPGIDPNLVFDFYNNIIPRFGANDCSLPGVVLDYNVYTNPGGGNPSTGWPTCGAHDKTSTLAAEFVDPTFSTGVPPNMHLNPTAVAVDDANPSSYTTTDIEGHTRPCLGSPDAGAYEEGC